MNYPHIGLDCWSPNINIARDPRWGRNQEVPSEDPFVNGMFGTQYTLGIQGGDDSRFLNVAVTLKHWDAYSLEDADGYTRYNFDAIVSNYSLADTYWPAFQASIVQGKAKGVMCSYNSVNGQPACASDRLSTVLRGAWGFDGYITSDSGALVNIYKDHKYVKTEVEAACVAVRNGTCDVNSGPVYHNALLQSVDEGLCSMKDVEAALFRTFKLRVDLGLFDPIEDQPYWHVPLSAVGAQASKDNSLLASLSSMVLLQNDASTLPLVSGGHIAVIGPHANATLTLVGMSSKNYASPL
jgi:beta-D-xylosidase 4